MMEGSKEERVRLARSVWCHAKHTFVQSNLVKLDQTGALVKLAGKLYASTLK